MQPCGTTGMPEKEVRNAVVWGYEHGTEGVKSGGPVGFRVHKGSIGYVAREAFPQVSDNQGMTKNEISENGDFPGGRFRCAEPK